MGSGISSGCKYKSAGDLTITKLKYKDTVGRKDMSDVSKAWTSENDDCTIGECTIKAKDCESDYSKSNLLMIGKKVQGNQNVEDGYKDEVCV